MPSIHLTKIEHVVAHTSSEINSTSGVTNIRNIYANQSNIIDLLNNKADQVDTYTKAQIDANFLIEFNHTRRQKLMYYQIALVQTLISL